MSTSRRLCQRLGSFLPASQRSRTFYIGRRFDPVSGGVDTAKTPNAFLF